MLKIGTLTTKFRYRSYSNNPGLTQNEFCIRQSALIIANQRHLSWKSPKIRADWRRLADNFRVLRKSYNQTLSVMRKHYQKYYALHSNLTNPAAQNSAMTSQQNQQYTKARK